jgi:hypothetical protein
MRCSPQTPFALFYAPVTSPFCRICPGGLHLQFPFGRQLRSTAVGTLPMRLQPFQPGCCPGSHQHRVDLPVDRDLDTSAQPLLAECFSRGPRIAR